MKSKFVRSPVALGVAAALGVGVVPYAVAQEEPENEVIEEIVTTGIRSSLSSAQAMKENADTFVDGVTASDIGALPDRSVAEALQRIPGVNIGRFKKSTDPDRFSVEGADVIIRGLPFVRSELNGRDVFSATGGTVLSFNDVSPELLGGVLVYKNATASMIDGGIAGTVNLQTRKPLDTDGIRFAASTEYNYGDLAEEGSPTISLLGSNSWENDAGRFGIQVGFAQSELNTISNASQVTDPCYRAPTLDAGCIRAATTADGTAGDLVYDADTFPSIVADALVVPKGAGVRTTAYERDREALSLIAQWENTDGTLLVTAEYLRAEADLFVDEHAMLALVNDDNLFPTPPLTGSDWQFGSDGFFQSGTLSQVASRGDPAFTDNCVAGSLDAPVGLTRPCVPQQGIQTENLRFQRKDQSVTDDVSLAVSWMPNDNLTLNFEAQHLESERSEDGIIAVTTTYADVWLDNTGETPDVQFRAPTVTDGSSDPNYFTNDDRTFHWFLIDSQIENDAYMDTFKADLEYYFGEEGFVREVKFGARWSDRNRTTRDNRFGNWGVLSAPWVGDISWVGPGWEEIAAPTFASDPNAAGIANVYDPFADFQRGEVSTPVPNGSSIYFGGDNLLNEYYNGTTEQQARQIHALNVFDIWGDTRWLPVSERGGLQEGVFLPGEISDVREVTEALYVQVDFSLDTAMPIDGNFGVRYVETTIETVGELQFPIPPVPDAAQFCGVNIPPPLPGFCSLSAARTAEFNSAFTGELIDDSADIKFDHVLPSLNVKMQVTDDFLVRAAASKAISRPDLGAFQTGGLLGDNTNALRDGGTLETGPLFGLQTGNRLLVPVEAWNYDLSAEWYFSNVGSLTFSLFRKEFEKLISNGATVRTITTDTGVTALTEVRGPSNIDKGSLDGFELAYQQTFDMLPSPFNGLGAQMTYTYVDGSDMGTPTDSVLRQPFASGLGFSGISEDTFNLVGFYEDDTWSARLAYNWRSEFLITPRDDIFPYSPVIGEDTGQLDGSVFYNFNDFYGLENFKIGLQAVNLLDEVTQTSQVIDYEGNRVRRSAFRNDRRYTLAARFTF